MRTSGFKKLFVTAGAVLATLAVAAGCSREAGKKIVIKGSTTVLPITQKAMEEYRKTHPGIRISVDGSGSGNGITALINGSTDIANSSREMKAEELKKSKDKGIDIEEVSVCYDMIVPVVHPSNKVKNLTMEQLKAIYDGSVTNWKDVGGDDGKIVVISRDTSSGTYEYWHEKIMAKKDVRKDALLQASSGQVITSVAGNPRAIAYVGFGYLNSTVRGLNVNGIEATMENGKSKKYPIARKLYIYYNKKKISGEAQEFVNFLTSPDGQKIVKDAGFIPL